MGRTPCCSKVGLHRGAWSSDEDKLLINHIQTHGEGQWRALPSKAGLLRCGKSCRLRWMNYLRPGIRRGNFTSDENDVIIRLHSVHGNRWSLIATELPGRTDNEIKNHWNAHLRKLPHTAHKDKLIQTKARKKRTPPKSTKVKNSHPPPPAAAAASCSSNESSVSGASSMDPGGIDFDFPFLEYEDENLVTDLLISKDDESIMLEKLYHEYLNLLTHE